MQLGRVLAQLGKEPFLWALRQGLMAQPRGVVDNWAAMVATLKTHCRALEDLCLLLCCCLLFCVCFVILFVFVLFFGFGFVSLVWNG